MSENNGNVTGHGMSPKCHSRVIDGKLAVKRAERWLQLYPHKSAHHELIRDMKLALGGLLDEVAGT